MDIVTPNPSSIASWAILILSHRSLDFSIEYLYWKKGNFTGYSVFYPMLVSYNNLIVVQMQQWAHLQGPSCIFHTKEWLTFLCRKSSLDHQLHSSQSTLKSAIPPSGWISKWAADDPVVVSHEGRLYHCFAPKIHPACPSCTIPYFVRTAI